MLLPNTKSSTTKITVKKRLELVFLPLARKKVDSEAPLPFKRQLVKIEKEAKKR